jgi:hypothetical protein
MIHRSKEIYYIPRMPGLRGSWPVTLVASVSFVATCFLLKMLFQNSAAALGMAVFAGVAAASNKASWDDYYKKDYISYSTVTGFFQQDDAATVPGTFNYVSTNSRSQWI